MLLYINVSPAPFVKFHKLYISLLYVFHNATQKALLIFFFYIIVFFLQDHINTCKTHTDKVKYKDEDIGSFMQKSSKKSKSKKRKINKKEKKHKKKRKCSSSSSVNVKDFIILKLTFIKISNKDIISYITKYF